jgi:hypothetical protein
MQNEVYDEEIEIVIHGRNVDTHPLNEEHDCDSSWPPRSGYTLELQQQSAFIPTLAKFSWFLKACIVISTACLFIIGGKSLVNYRRYADITTSGRDLSVASSSPPPPKSWMSTEKQREWENSPEQFIVNQQAKTQDQRQTAATESTIVKTRGFYHDPVLEWHGSRSKPGNPSKTVFQDKTTGQQFQLKPGTHRGKVFRAEDVFRSTKEDVADEPTQPFVPYPPLPKAQQPSTQQPSTQPVISATLPPPPSLPPPSLPAQPSLPSPPSLPPPSLPAQPLFSQIPAPHTLPKLKKSTIASAYTEMELFPGRRIKHPSHQRIFQYIRTDYNKGHVFKRQSDGKWFIIPPSNLLTALELLSQ